MKVRNPKNYYKCFICGKEFYRSPSCVTTKLQTCSRVCAGKKQTVVGRGAKNNTVCVVCEVEFHVKPSHSFRRKTCSRDCAAKLRSYRTGSLCPAWKGGFVNSQGYKVVENGQYEHRKVMEEKLGRALLGSEIVHHVDGDKLNNNPDNLEIVSRADHMKMHDPHGWRKRACA